jgi:hypothetical protein
MLPELRGEGADSLSEKDFADPGTVDRMQAVNTVIEALTGTLVITSVVPPPP